MQIPISLVAGACVGALATFGAMRNTKPPTEGDFVHASEPKEQALQQEELAPFSDPSGSSLGINLDSGEASEHPHGYTKMDMSDVFQRDLCISFWYLDMNTVVDNLELHTGHKFERQVGKVYASPAEILEEQAAFLRGFEDETRRIEAAAHSDSDSKSETE